MALDGSQGVVGQPAFELVLGLLAGEDLEPDDPAPAAIGLGDGRVEHPVRSTPDVRTRPIAFNEGDDRAVGNGQTPALMRDRFSVFRRRQVFVGRGRAWHRVARAYHLEDSLPQLRLLSP